MAPVESPAEKREANVPRRETAGELPQPAEHCAPNAMSGKPDAPGSLLNGLSGLAIGLILLAHFMPNYPMPNRPLEMLKKLAFAGWSGVDLAFVLCGLFVTDALLRSRGKPHAARDFYQAGFLRMMPLYFASLALVFGVLPLLVRPGADPGFDVMRSFQDWYWAGGANLVCFRHGFSAMESSTVSLGHYWVLAIIQHFYLLWPLMVLNVRERRLPWLFAATVGLALALRLAGSCLLDGVYHDNVFYQTPACLDSFAFGALLAVLFRRGDAVRLRRAALVLLPLTGTIVAALFVQKTLWEGNKVVHCVGLTLISLGYASLIVLLRTGLPGSIAVKLFDNPVLRFFGKYGLGLYVIHGLLMPVLDRWVPADRLLDVCQSAVVATVVCLTVKVAASLMLAMASWRLLEAPCLRMKAAS